MRFYGKRQVLQRNARNSKGSVAFLRMNSMRQVSIFSGVRVRSLMASRFSWPQRASFRRRRFRATRKHYARWRDFYLDLRRNGWRKREKRSKSCSQCMLLDDSLRLIGYEELATVMESIG
jgi:hypothetical protein